MRAWALVTEIASPSNAVVESGLTAPSATTKRFEFATGVSLRAPPASMKRSVPPIPTVPAPSLRRHPASATGTFTFIVTPSGAPNPPKSFTKMPRVCSSIVRSSKASRSDMLSSCSAL